MSPEVHGGQPELWAETPRRVVCTVLAGKRRGQLSGRPWEGTLDDTKAEVDALVAGIVDEAGRAADVSPVLGERPAT